MFCYCTSECCNTVYTGDPCGQPKTTMEGQTNEGSTTFNDILYWVSQELTDDDVKGMKLYLTDEIGEGRIQNCVSGLDIIQIMKTLGLIAPKNIDRLTEILTHIRKEKLCQYIRENYSPPTDPNTVLIRDYLKRRYRRQSKLRPFSFCGFREVVLDNMYTTSVEVCAEKHRVLAKDGRITLGPNIWNEDGRTVSLLEGVNGVGKTTLCRELSYQWSMKDNLVCGQSFDMVFVLEARMLSGDLKQSIFQQLFPKDYSIDKDLIYKILQKPTNRCLLVIDGVDEIPTNSVGMLTSLIKGEYLHDVNIILTGRPQMSAEFVERADNHLRITGYTATDAGVYVRKFFCILETCFGIYCDLHHMAKNPFMTIQFCDFLSERRVRLFENRMITFKELLQKMLQIYTKKQVRLRERQSLENKLLSAAGKLAWFSFTNNLLEFSKTKVRAILGEDIGNHILQCGIINTRYSLTGNEIGVCYFVHHSIQNYLCLLEIDKL